MTSRINATSVACMCVAGFLFSVDATRAEPADLLRDAVAELATPAQGSMQQVEMLSTAGEACSDWLAKKKDPEMHIGKNEKPHEFYVAIGSSPIRVSPGHDNYVNARQNAYDAAMLEAKADFYQLKQQQVETQVMLHVTDGKMTKDMRDNEYTEARSTELQKVGTKALRLLNAELDAELTKRGLAAEDVAQSKREEVARQILNTAKYRKYIRASAKSQLKGVRRVFVNESVRKGESGQICVVALYSDNTAALADAIFSGSVAAAPMGEHGRPIVEQIQNWRDPKGVLALMTTYGTETLRDEEGVFHLVSYAQAGPQGTGPQAMANAEARAQLLAVGELRSFAQESAMVETATESAETAQELAEGNKDYESSNALDRKLQSVSSKITLNGIQKVGSWAAKHPLTGQPVVGVIVQWSAPAAVDAKKTHDALNATPTAGNRSRNSISANAGAKKNFSGSAEGGSSGADF